MKIITLSGVDGSGKSTQLQLLKQSLEAQGKTVAYFHAVAFSLPQRARVLFTRPSRKTLPAAAKTSSGFWGIFFRKLILLVDVIRFRFFLNYLRHAGTDYLLSDRYYYDSLVNIAYLDGTPLATPFSRLAACLIPKPTIAFSLLVTPENVMQRKRVPEQGLRYLQDKTQLFGEATRLWSFISIDADQSPEMVASLVSKAINEQL